MTNHTTGLGAFSVSLAVKDLATSRAFYQKLGFEPVGGDGDRWLILRSGTTTIGLFEGMFERNTLTFNPGWDASANTLPEFTDVRALQRRLKEAGIEPTLEADESGQGPASLDDSAARDDPIADGRRQQVDLEFGAQYPGPGRHEAQRRVPRRGIGDGSHGRRMDEAVLLRDGGTWTNRYLDGARRDLAERRAER